MKDLRGYGLILVIAILIAIFSQSLVWAIFETPKYEDYCKGPNKDYPYLKEPQDCRAQDCKAIPYSEVECEKGYLEAKLDEKGCPKEYFCQPCQIEYDKVMGKYNLKVFISMTILGAIAILVGLYLPQKNNPLNEFIGTGFILGGVISIFIGTMQYFQDAHKAARPIILLAELLLVLYLAYKKIKIKR